MAVKVRERKWTYRYLMFSLLTLLFTISMSVTAFGGQFEDAVAAYGRDDYATAYRLFKLLAEQGDAKSQFNLALMYDDGQGVPKSDAEAVKWYRRAAEQGDASSQLNLGVMYYKGQGVPQDYVLSHMWLNLAASKFPASEGEKREIAVENINIVASEMTLAQVTEAQRLAQEWKPKKEVR